MKLANPIALTEYANIACIPDDGENPKIQEVCYAAGWGHITESKLLFIIK